MTPETLLAFSGAALLLGLVAVLIDRLNFPQSRFRSSRVSTEGRGPHRDRTGAHVIDEDPPPAEAGREDQPGA